MTYPPMASVSEILVCATKALEDRLRLLRPFANISKGYVSLPEENLLPGVELHQFSADLRSGGGNEMDQKFRAAWSSSALVANCFARFKHEPKHLSLGGLSGFGSPVFEQKCATGLRGEPPNLDLVCEGDDGIVAIESKCIEYIREKKRAGFSSAYFEQIQDERRGGKWFAAMEHVTNGAMTFDRLDVAQLIKHAFGLARCFKGKSCTLLYLFWEPSNAARFSIFPHHRMEVAKFAQLVEGGFPRFVSLSYPELWSSWASLPSTRASWLFDHVQNLQDRYLVALTPCD